MSENGNAGPFLGLLGVVVPAMIVSGWMAWLSLVGPYGMFQPMPRDCAAGRTCVLVAGLDGDVRYNPVGGGNVQFDVADDSTQQLVLWLRAAQAGADVRAYPREIAVPNLGRPDEDKRAHAALDAARMAGRTYHARLVVVGAVRGNDNLWIAFVDPSSSAGLQLRPYAIEGGEISHQFSLDYAAALRGESLTPPGQGSADAAAEAPPGDATATAIPVVAPPPPARIENPSVHIGPTNDEMMRAYPRRARHRSIAGHADVRCTVALDESLHDCVVSREWPSGEAFGEAALGLAQHTTAHPKTVDGVPTDGGQITISYDFPPR